MRSMSLLLSMLVLSSLMFAQQKYLVSPRDEVIPLRRGESPASVIAKQNARSISSSSAVCGTQFIFGYPEDKFPANSNFGAYHKDVMGEWFVAKATGSIDTIYWESLGSVGAKDSVLYMRVHKSLIGPTYGPGVRPGPWEPPCQNWGYWVNTNDLDQGVAAFPDDATDTTWHSTIAAGPATGKPFSNSLWGFTGYPVTDHANKINKVAMLDIGTPLNVSTGDQFFISQRVNGPAGHTVDARTEFAASGFHVANDDENYPSRDWKFYEHDSGPSNCAGVPVNLVKRGWVARGGFSEDTLDVAAFNYWYSMTVSTNVPPDVAVTGILHNTFDTGDQLLEATIIDCDPAVPARAGIKSAVIIWQLNGTPQTDVPMSNVGGDNFEGTIPGEPAGNTITYKIYACDSTNSCSYGPPVTYRIASFGSGYYAVDTALACTPKSIAATGTTIPKSAFYLPSTAGTTAAALDDGTAGPIDLGGNVLYFGDAKRYAWIGIDGGMALSAGNGDTVDVNADGFYTQWTIPSTPMRVGGRSDTSHGLRMPQGFVAPFWADLWDGDSVTNCAGGVRYQLGYGGDTCMVIVEWDSIGGFAPLGGSTCDNTTFRVIFNKCDGTVEYQYDDVGGLGLDSNAVVGLVDSSAITSPNIGSVFVNDYTFPYETKPRNNWCIKFYPATIVNALNGWNLLSVGVTPFGGYGTANVFPGSVGTVYGYSGSGYTPVTTTANGPGYWAKFPPGTGAVGARGGLLSGVTANVNSGWNMVGAAGRGVAVGSVQQTPGGIVTSNYFNYGNAGYAIASTLTPGRGHWVKTNAAGTLGISASNAPGKNSPATNLSELNTITITDAAGRKQTLYIGSETKVVEALSFYEMPPAAPDFDARYTSGRLLETYPEQLDARASYEYPIAIQATAFPVTVQWNVNVNDRQLVLTTADGKLGNTVMSGVGRVKINDASVKGVVVRVTTGVVVPKEFALGQNYPNPFNPSTRITVDIPKLTDVTVAVYDILGRQITTLLSGQQTAGVKTIEWDGTDARGSVVPTGVYFVRMSAEDFSATRKIMLMK